MCSCSVPSIMAQINSPTIVGMVPPFAGLYISFSVCIVRARTELHSIRLARSKLRMLGCRCCCFCCCWSECPCAGSLCSPVKRQLCLMRQPAKHTTPVPLYAVVQCSGKPPSLSARTLMCQFTPSLQVSGQPNFDSFGMSARAMSKCLHTFLHLRQYHSCTLQENMCQPTGYKIIDRQCQAAS